MCVYMFVYNHKSSGYKQRNVATVRFAAMASEKSMRLEVWVVVWENIGPIQHYNNIQRAAQKYFCIKMKFICV